MEEEKQSSQKEELTFLVLAITFSLLLIVTVVFFVLRPLFLNISSLQIELKNTQEEEKALLEKINILKSLTEEYKNLEKQVLMAEAALPSEEGLDQLFVQLENLAKANGLTVQSFEKKAPQQPVAALEETSSETNPEMSASQNPTEGFVSVQSPTPVLSSFDFSLKLGGTYSSFKAFLEGLEKNIRPIFIDSVSLSKFSSSSKSNYLDISLEGKTFYLKK